MERLRHVARSEGIDPAIVVAETVEALTGLRPAPSELVPLCRNLVERNPTCGPLWWLCAHLLAKPESVPDAWRLADELEGDRTATRLAEAIRDDATVMTVGYPVTGARALRRCGSVSVVAMLAGEDGHRMVRAMDRAGIDVEPVQPEAMLDATRRVDFVVLEAEACSTDTVVASMGTGLAAVAAAAVGVPVWLIAGRGRRLPVPFVEAIGRAIDERYETFPAELATIVAGPDAVAPRSDGSLAAECPAVPELLP